MNRLLSRFVGVAVVAALGASASGCTSETGNSTVDAALQSPFTPVVIKVLKRQAARINGPAGIAAWVGLYEIEQLRKESLRKANSTYLVVKQQLDGRHKASVFRFDSGHKVRVAMNGKFDELIDGNVITLTADPAVDSTIVVTDATTGDAVERTGSFHLGLAQTKAYTGIDFDTGTQLRGDDGSMDYSYYKMKFTNGARLYKWDKKGDPQLADCSSVPRSEWSDSSMYLRLGRGDFCIVTSDARFGFLHLGGTIVASTTYTIWPPLA